MTSRSLLVVLAALAFASAACTADPVDRDVGLETTFAASMASSWHYAGDPQRVQIGIFGTDRDGTHVVSGGTIDLAFSYFGEDGGADPSAGPEATAEYVPVPGTDPAGDEPGIATGARGVYEAEDVVFDRAGVWEVTVSASIDGLAQRLAASIQVLETSPIPAPGDRAPRTETL
ncbi:MAG TPA: hypothetical protein VF108_10310, partial [Actinomycetota bacterium]